MSQTVSGILVTALEKIGVKHIFGLISDSLNPIGDVVRQSKIEWVGVRHEEGGALAASGQAKLNRSAWRLLRINRPRQHPSNRRPL
ncbi:MAG: thiamine pyrophosphate-binding protein [Methylovirgula sp.]